MTIETSQLVAQLKRQLKARDLTYSNVARALKLSEGSVKRLFSTERFTLERLAQISRLAGCTVAELCLLASAAAPEIEMLTPAQEAQLVSDEKLLLVAACTLNHWPLKQILGTYLLTESEALKRLIVLDRMGLLELLPGNRVRLRVRRDFHWLPDGPIRAYFHDQGLTDFLQHPFREPGEAFEFTHAALTVAARSELDLELQRLRDKLGTLHRESTSALSKQKFGVGLLLATREWEPAAFRKLRRKP
jgi:transcriptional regulator with XRE-family HTH domain